MNEAKPGKCEYVAVSARIEAATEAESQAVEEGLRTANEPKLSTLAALLYEESLKGKTAEDDAAATVLDGTP